MKLKTKDTVFVVLQFLLFAMYCFKVELINFQVKSLISNTGILLIVLGVLLGIISLLQLNKNLSPFPTPKTNSTLITHGIYKHIRHPIYSSITFFILGYGLYSSSLYKILISLLLLILFYFKSAYEEKLLSKKYSNYKTYKQTAGRFLPKF
jgi:protein-S-isoprenylcysteine O-methyltransferase Ste14